VRNASLQTHHPVTTDEMPLSVRLIIFGECCRFGDSGDTIENVPCSPQLHHDLEISRETAGRKWLELWPVRKI
jgi:hypothetical protein